MTSQPIRILLVEDNPGDAGLFRIFLDEMDGEPFGCDLTHVIRLVEALAYLDKSKFDVVFIDLSLPDASGLEAVARVRAHAPDLPIVVMTGFGDDSLAEEVRRAGAVEFVVKDQADGPTLARVIERAVGGPSAKAQLL